MKRILALLLTLAMIMSFSACGKDSETSSAPSAVSAAAKPDTDTSLDSDSLPAKFTGFVVNADDSEFVKSFKETANALFDAGSFDFEVSVVGEKFFDMNDIISIEGEDEDEFNEVNEDKLNETATGALEYNLAQSTFKLNALTSEGNATIFSENGKGYIATRDSSDTDWKIELTDDVIDSDKLASSDLISTMQSYINSMSEMSYNKIIKAVLNLLGFDENTVDSAKFEAEIQKLADEFRNKELNTSYFSISTAEESGITTTTITVDVPAITNRLTTAMQTVFITEEDLQSFNQTIGIYTAMYADMECTISASVNTDKIPVSLAIKINIPQMMKFDIIATIKNVGTAKFVQDESLSAQLSDNE